SVFAFDNYFTGSLTDSIEGMRYTPALPRYVTTPALSTTVPVNGSTVLNISAVTGGDAASPSQEGFLLLYRDAAAKTESSVMDGHPHGRPRPGRSERRRGCGRGPGGYAPRPPPPATVGGKNTARARVTSSAIRDCSVSSCSSEAVARPRATI